MSKSVYAIGGMGIAGCLMLSFMMQHLLKVKQDRAQSPVALELQELFTGRLDGPVQVHTQQEGGELTMRVRMTIRDGDPKQIVRGAAGMAWRCAAQLQEPPRRMIMEVLRPGDDAPAVVELGARGVAAPQRTAPGSPSVQPPPNGVPAAPPGVPAAPPGK